MKRRVAFISVVPSPYQRDLFAALAERPEIDLEVFYLEATAPDSPWPEKPLCPYEQILPGFWFSLGNARIHLNWQLPDLGNYDITVVNSLMSLTAQRLMRGSLMNRPWIFFGERLSTNRRRWHDWLTAPLHRASAIAAIGRWAQHDYAKRFPKPRSFSLPYACELSSFLAQPRHALGDEPVFLFCGQMIARKGVDLLLEAFAKLNRGRLLLVGREAELPALLTRIPRAAHARIEYLGFHPPEALPGLFAKADAFVLPSRYDGWGVVVNQAIGAGLPIICSDQVGAGYDLVSENVNGLKFRAGDVEDLLRAMRHFTEHPETIKPMGDASRGKAAEWVPSVAAERWVEAILQVLAS